jgi:hypothetical protein
MKSFGVGDSMEIILKENNIVTRQQKDYKLSQKDYDKVRDCLIIIDELLNNRYVEKGNSK